MQTNHLDVVRTRNWLFVPFPSSSH
jgi:hypothetical protein